MVTGFSMMGNWPKDWLTVIVCLDPLAPMAKSMVFVGSLEALSCWRA